MGLLSQLLILVRIITVFYSIIPDCDEVFNYYEPLNFLTRGFGKQTWEYSPEYAIRSWSYLLPYIIPITPLSAIVDHFQLTPSITFYAIRLLTVSFTIYAELHLYKTLTKWGIKLASWYLLFTLVSTGYSHAGVALLPSSLAMNCVTLATSNFLRFLGNGSTRNALLVTHWFAIGGLYGWPFALVLALPSTLYTLSIYYFKDPVKFKRYLLWSIVIFFFHLVVVMEIDYHYYDRSVLVPLNIVLYNVIHADKESGPNIFGTEPLSYYIINLLLNFNGIAFLAYFGSIALPFLNFFFKLRHTPLQIITITSPLILWSVIFFSQPHKEERFLYPVYSLINLTAAFTVFFLIELFFKILPVKIIKKFLTILTILIITITSILKTISLSLNYSAPLSVYAQIPSDAQGNLCVGREWYRYPSSFFLPSNLRLKFIQSNFNGLLPGDFNETLTINKAISTVPENMNNKNLFDSSKLVDFAQCDYVIDIDQPIDIESNEISMIDSNGDVKQGWELIHSEAFLDNDNSEGWGRLLYIPESLHEITKTNLVHHNYNLYAKKAVQVEKEQQQAENI